MAELGGDVQLKGYREFQRAVEKIPTRFKRDALLKVLRRSTGYTIRAIRNQLNRHDNTGNLWNSVGNITGKSREFPNVLVGYRVRGTFKNSYEKRGRGRYKGHHGHLLEYGTGERYRGPKKSTRLKAFRRRISTGKGPALHIVENAARQSHEQSVKLLEKEAARFVKMELKKLFK